MGFNELMSASSPRIPIAAALAAMLLASCAGSPGARSDLPESGRAQAAAGPSARDALDAERARLAGLFKGTPVVFVTTSEGNLRATVPRRYCFDPGASAVKPPLAAVLGRIAKSQVATASRFRVAVPADPNLSSALANERALRVRDWLVDQGIATGRVQVTGTVQAEQLELFVIPARAD